MTRIRKIVLASLLLTGSISCLALDPQAHLSQLGHTAWRVRDGAFSGAVNAMTQTTDGYLWIGTNNGLIRYDGVGFILQGDGTILALDASSDGSLWFGTGQSLLHMDHGKVQRIQTPKVHVNAIRQDTKGNIWFTRSRIDAPDEGALCEVIGKGMHCLKAADGVPLPYAEALAIDSGGDIWVASSSQLVRGRPGAFEEYPHPELNPAETSNGIASLSPRADGTMLVGISRTGPGLGLQNLAGRTWRDAYLHPAPSSNWSVTATLVDRDGTVWVGTADQGLFRVRVDGTDHFGETDGLSGNSVSSLYEDREGDVWVGTKKGLDRFRNLFVETISTSEGLAGDSVHSVATSASGGVWIGNKGSLSYLKSGKITNYTRREGLPGQRVTSLLEDHARRLWIGVDGDLYLFSQGRFRRILDHEGKSSGVITGITEDSEQNIFVLANGQPRRLMRFDPASASLAPVSLPINPDAIAANPDGGLFIDGGSSGGALHLYQQGKTKKWTPQIIVKRTNLAFSRDKSKWSSTPRGIELFNRQSSRFLDTTNGLPCVQVFSIILDQRENLWAYASCGLIFIANGELSRFEKDPKYSVSTHLFDVYDGALPNTADFSPNAAGSTDGRIWFANGTDLQVVDPAHWRAESPAPEVQIETIVAHHLEYKALQGMRLAPLTQDVDIRYNAPSLSVPERLRFRYRLDGHDKEWQDITKLRDAFYTGLRPGRYIFRVTASQSDGIWSGEASLPFTILPAWYQTKSFIAVCLAVGLLACIVAYRLRIRMVRREALARYEDRLAERTRIAREIHDTLLQTIQGSKMLADTTLAQLKEQDEIHPRVQMLSTWLDNAMEEGRTALRSLRAAVVENQTLEVLLEDAIDDCSISGSMKTSLEIIGEPAAMSVCVREEIYRIGHEAIMNACRHSAGTHLEVRLSYAETFQLRVKDDGDGINERMVEDGRSGHFGIAGMRERARFLQANLRFNSSPGIGTEVVLTVPRSLLQEEARPSKWGRFLNFLRG
jgi:signal transduction histidine kinase/ligand-binding sensor domain-containing protein